MQLLFTGTNIWWSQVKNKNKPKKKNKWIQDEEQIEKQVLQGGRGGEGRGSTFAKTLGRCMFLKNQTTTLLKAYLWFATNTPAKNEQLALYS